ncbi:MAG TPA: type II toxin-antitoxin system ParD family antitoxin [Tepidisphaeraceae bacterium]|jgi:antitoxin ParD1/3/4
MHVQIKPELQRFMDDQIKSGLYESSDDMINAALATLQAREDLSSQEIEELRAEVDEGIAEADRGEFVDFTAETIIARCRAKSDSANKGL